MKPSADRHVWDFVASCCTIYGIFNVTGVKVTQAQAFMSIPFIMYSYRVASVHPCIVDTALQIFAYVLTAGLASVDPTMMYPCWRRVQIIWYVQCNHCCIWHSWVSNIENAGSNKHAAAERAVNMGNPGNSNTGVIVMRLAIFIPHIAKPAQRNT